MPKCEFKKKSNLSGVTTRVSLSVPGGTFSPLPVLSLKSNGKKRVLCLFETTMYVTPGWYPAAISEHASLI